MIYSAYNVTIRPFRHIGLPNRRLYQEDYEREPEPKCQDCIYYDDPNVRCDGHDEICDDFRGLDEE